MRRSAYRPERREEFQRNLIRSHATTLGARRIPPPFVRAAMLLRAQVLAFGYSGADPAVESMSSLAC